MGSCATSPLLGVGSVTEGAMVVFRFLLLRRFWLEDVDDRVLVVMISGGGSLGR